MRPIVVVGDLNIDVVLSNMERLPSPGEELFLDRSILKAGGSAANTAITLAHAGCHVSLFARIGADEGAAFLLGSLRSAGVVTSSVKKDPGTATGITVSLPFPGADERAYLTFPGSISTTRVEDLKRGCLKRAAHGAPGAHLHLSSFFLQAGLQEGIGPLLKGAKEYGMTTSLDPGRYPASGRGLGRIPDGKWNIDALVPFLLYIDWFMPNAAELEAITGKHDPERALEDFAAEVKGVVVKQGAMGVLTRYEGRIERYPSWTAPPLDTTCAGDCFDAGFLHGLSRELSLGESVSVGTRFGALAVSCLGLPTKEMIRSLLKEIYNA